MSNIATIMIHFPLFPEYWYKMWEWRGTEIAKSEQNTETIWRDRKVITRRVRERDDVTRATWHVAMYETHVTSNRQTEYQPTLWAVLLHQVGRINLKNICNIITKIFAAPRFRMWTSPSTGWRTRGSGPTRSCTWSRWASSGRCRRRGSSSPWWCCSSISSPAAATPRTTRWPHLATLLSLLEFMCLQIQK